MSGAADAAGSTARSERDLRIDFFRGLALIFIFIDHVPGNILSVVTIGSFGFSDAAEVFIFLSGYSAAFVYGRVQRARGFIVALAQIWKRCWQLYVAHIFLFVVFTAEVAYIAARFRNPMFAEEMNVANFLQEPHIAVMMALSLQFQPAFMDILPLYIALLLLFPFALWGIERSPALVLAISVAAYVVQWWFNFDMPAYPEGSNWFFNPFAWQLLFVIGAVIGHATVAGRRLVLRGWPIIAAAGAIVAGSLIIVMSWKLANISPRVPALLLDELWPVDKTDLALVRLVHFLAVAYLVAVLVPPEHRMLRAPAAYPVILCGQNSLHIFCLSIFLCVIGHLAVVQLDYAFWVQALVNGFGIGIMMLTAGIILVQVDRANGKGPDRRVNCAAFGRELSAA